MNREFLTGYSLKRDTSCGGCNDNLPLNRATVIAPQSRTIARFALQALHQELAAFPKPGLVSPVDSGSHRDMDAALFFRSLFSLRHYFCEIAAAGRRGAGFAELKQFGLAAEERMMQATSGVNTHRGAIFNLGLLAAAAGALQTEGRHLQAEEIAGHIRSSWGDAIKAHGAALPKNSHGGVVAERYGVGGALQEAACGFPHVFEVGLPALLECHARGCDQNRAAVQCLFVLMSMLADTNLLYRGGETGLRFVRRVSRAFIADGGVFQSDWQERAADLHRQFVEMNLSPGGSADLLAATLFVRRLLQRDNTCRRDIKDVTL